MTLSSSAPVRALAVFVGSWISAYFLNPLILVFIEMPMTVFLPQNFELSGVSGKLVEILRAADNLRDNDVTLRDSPHDYSRPGPEP